MPRYRISKRFDFAASHTLRNLPEGHPCGRLHGHNYSVWVTLAGARLDAAGMVLDYRALQPFKEYLDSTCDHRDLNAVVPQPTAENLAMFLLGVAQRFFGECVESVTVAESEKTWAEARP